MDNYWYIIDRTIQFIPKLIHRQNSSKISFSDFMAATENGNVSEVNISGNNVTGFLNDGRAFNTYAPNYPNLVDKLNDKGIK